MQVLCMVNVYERPEFIRIPLRNIPVEIMQKYNLHQFVHGEFVLFRIDKGMYRHPQEVCWHSSA